MSFENNHIIEKDLLVQVSRGDRDAYRDLYTTYFSYVQQYIRLFEPSGEYLQELTQDVFIRIWEKRERLAGVEMFRNYLFLMTRNVVFNYIKAMKVHKRVRDLEEMSDTVGAVNQENELLFKQYYQIAMDAIEKLPTGRRKILKMSIDDGMTLDEIAEKLQISKSGVKKQLYAATAYIRQYLQEHGELTVLLFVFLSLFEL